MTAISRAQAALSTDGDDSAPPRLQPLLHDLSSCLRAPSLVLSSQRGDVHPAGVQGWYVGDVRLVHTFELLVGGRRPDAIASRQLSAAGAHFTGLARNLDEPESDPTVVVELVRRVRGSAWEETIRVTSSAQQPVRSELSVHVEAGFEPMASVRMGADASSSATATAARDGLRWSNEAGALVVSSDPPPSSVHAEGGALTYPVHLGHGDVLEVRFRFDWEPTTPPEFSAPDRVPWTAPDLSALPAGLRRLLEQGLDDLDGLLLRDNAGPEREPDLFLAAGSPWFFTLFGRDSLLAARLLLPLGTGLALSTLRVLARRQGTASDPVTEEEPGKILHEVRSGELQLGSMHLPPLYYGTVDATPLWLTLLVDVWRKGADDGAVRELLPNALAAWDCVEKAAADDGFLRYVDHTGKGLANQGWKDSPDGVQWADGRLADPPIALCEVQAYAYEAATGMADLVDAFPVECRGIDSESLRRWAHRLRERFRAEFWVEDQVGRYPAVALDRDGRAVDSVASNMAHLLGTGLLDADEAAAVADRLASPEMNPGLGLRTLSSASPRFSMLSYHGGTVWPHDTAIAALGLAKEGHLALARSLVDGLVAAAPGFGYRLPELYAVPGGHAEGAPVPFPTACRPQAWAAAAPFVALHPAFHSDC